jgi:hypothetical protein
MSIAPLAGDAIRRRMEESLGLVEPVAPRPRRRRRPVVRTTSAVVLRRLADRLEPASDPA